MANCTSSSRLLKSDTANENPTNRMSGKAERPRRLLKKSSSKAAASEGPRRTLWYVEGLNDARTTLADFFSSLQGLRLVSHRLIQLRQARGGQRELRLHLDARRH